MLDRMKGPVLKTREEIAIMDRANRVVLEILEIMRSMVKPGATTAQLNAVAEDELAKRGAKSPFKGYSPMNLPPYPAVVCASVNDVIVHGIPNRAKLQEGDIIGLDFGSILDGFVGDGAITVPVGNVSTGAGDLVRTTKECLDLAIEEMRPGRRLGDIGAAVQEHAESRGFHVIRNFVGHGIGRKMHEEPQVYNYGKRGRGLELREGMVLAIEPMLSAGGPGIRTLDDGWTVVTSDRSLSAHFEHTIAITTEGPRVLTAASHAVDAVPGGA
jgi:methionyl aminopeptidase